MRKFLIGLLLAVVFPGIAYAAMNLRQGADSGASWLHTPTGNSYNVARRFVPIRITDLSTASSETSFVITGGVLTAIYCTQTAAITGSPAVVTLAIENAAGATSGAPLAQLTFVVGGSGLGVQHEVTALTQSVSAGAVIEVGTDGSSTGTSAANCTVVVDTNS